MKYNTLSNLHVVNLSILLSMHKECDVPGNYTKLLTIMLTMLQTIHIWFGLLQYSAARHETTFHQYLQSN